MKLGLSIKFIVCSSFLSLLIACSDTNNAREWLLKNDNLYSYNTLMQSQNWVAVHELSKINVIRLKMPDQTPYLFVERINGRTLTLFNQQQNYSIKIGEVTAVNFNNQRFSILIKNFEEVDKQSVALPRRASLEFIALKID